MRVGTVTALLDLFGIVCLAAFGWFVWPPAALLPLAGGALLSSWALSRGDDS